MQWKGKESCVTDNQLRIRELGMTGYANELFAFYDFSLYVGIIADGEWAVAWRTRRGSGQVILSDVTVFVAVDYDKDSPVAEEKNVNLTKGKNVNLTKGRNFLFNFFESDIPHVVKRIFFLIFHFHHSLCCSTTEHSHFHLGSQSTDFIS